MTTTASTAEILIVADASGVEAGLRQATSAADRAERALTGGANNSARSQQNLIGAIQRTTAAMEAGGRSGTRYFEIMARQRGVDPSALEPYLRQLRAVEQAQTRVGISVGQTANAMRQLPAQMTDVLVSLQGGQSPMTVLLQQGGQVVDSFGGVGNAIRNVGSRILGLANPVTVTAAAVAGLGYAYYKGAEEARVYNMAIATTGNAAGTSAALMAEAAAQTSSFVGSQNNAAKVLAGMVATGQISGEVMVDLSVAAIKAQRDLGREVGKTVDEFASLGRDPVKALADLISKYHHVTGATYAQVKALQDEGRTIEAVTLAQKAHAEGIEGQAKRVVENLGHIESAWRGIKGGVVEAAGAVKDWFLGLGREKTLASLMASAAGIQKNIGLANARKDTLGERKQQALLDVLNGEIAAMQKKLGLSQQQAEAEARNAKADALRIEIANGLDSLLSREQLRTRDLAAARTKAAEAGLGEAETQQLLAIVRKKYADVDEAAQKKRDAAAKAAAEALTKESALIAELSGVNGDYMEQLTRLQKVRDKGNLSEERYVALVTELIGKQPAAKKWIDEHTRALADQARATEDTIGRNAETLLQLQQRARGLELEIDLYGKTADAAVYAEAAKVRATASSLAISEEYRAELLAQAEMLERIAGLTRDRDALDASSKAAKQAADDWKRAAESIEQSLTDALLRGFESGKSFGKNLVDTLKNMFNTLVLRPLIQPIVSPLARGLAGVAPGSAQAATGAGGNAAALANVWGLMNGSAIGYGATKGVTSVANWMRDSSSVTMQNMGATLGQNAGWLSTGVGMLGNGLAGYGISKALSGGYSAGNWVNAAAGIASAIPGIGPIAGVVGAAINRAFGMKAKEYGDSTLNGVFDTGGFAGSVDTAWTQKGGWFRSDKSGVDKSAVDATMAGQLGTAYEALKAASADYARVLGINADHIASRSQAVSITLGKDEEANQKAIADFFTGVGDTMARELLPSLTAFQKEGEAAGSTLQRLATDYATIDAALTAIGMSFGAVGVASLEARERLIDATGGLEAFAANTASFAQNFLTEAERLAPVQQYVTEQLDAMGLASVDTRDKFKEVVLGLDLTTEAGARQYGELMQLQAAFAQVYPTLEQTASAADQAAEALRGRTQAYIEADAKRTALVASNAAAAADAQVRYLDGLAASAERAREAARALRDFSDSLSLGDLSPLSKEEQYSIAKTSLLSARPEDLQSAASAFLKASQGMDAGSLAYARDFAMVQQMIELAALKQDRNALIAESIAWSFAERLRRDVDGSHANGLDYVPFDGYRAELHRGERVLTAAEARGADAAATAVERLAGAVAAQQDSINKTSRMTERLSNLMEGLSDGGNQLRVVVVAAEGA